jgi:hypothetical protein
VGTLSGRFQEFNRTRMTSVHIPMVYPQRQSHRLFRGPVKAGRARGARGRRPVDAPPRARTIARTDRPEILLFCRRRNCGPLVRNCFRRPESGPREFIGADRLGTTSGSAAVGYARQLLVSHQSAHSDGRPTAGLLFLSLSEGRPSSDCRRRSGSPWKGPPWQPDSRDPDAR